MKAPKEKPNRQYTTSDMLSMYGLTNKGLFFYEKKGVITPERMPENQYRVFTMKECSRLFMARIYSKYGFSVDASAAAVEDISAEDLRELYDARRAALLEEAQYRQALARELEKTGLLLERILAGEDMRSVCVSPAMLRIEMLHPADARAAAPENSDAFQEWLGYLPFSGASMCVTMDSLLGGGELAYNLGFVMPLSMVRQLGVVRCSACTELPHRRCLYTVLEGSDTGFADPSRFAPALGRIAELGLSLGGDPFTRMLGLFDMGRGMLRYDEAWLPLV